MGTVFAVGKTTYINSFMAFHNGDAKYKHIIFVMADLSLEYHMDRSLHFREKALKGDDDHWKGKQEAKESHIHDMVADDRYLWVVESARYFSGMYECLVDANKQCDGGLRFILPVTDGPTMTIFMKDRCATRNKEFRADYWGADRVAYEARKRYTNAAEKWFKPNGIPYEVVEIDKTRSEFYRVGGILTAWLSVSADQWYGMTGWYKTLSRVKAGIIPDIEDDRPEPVEIDNQPQRRGRH